MAAPSIAVSLEWRASVQGKRCLIGSVRCIGKEDPSVTSCDRQGSIAARSPNGSGLTRFPCAMQRRRKRLRHVISKNIYRAAGRRVVRAAGVCSKRSRRVAIRAVFQTSSGCWGNGGIQNVRWCGLCCPLQGRRRSIGDWATDLADRRRGAVSQAARITDKRPGGES